MILEKAKLPIADSLQIDRQFRSVNRTGGIAPRIDTVN
jgi:hypothetical protein